MEDHKIAVFAQQAQGGASHQPNFMQGTHIVGRQLLAIGKFHIGLVHNHRTAYIGDDFFHIGQAIIIARGIIGIADD